MSKYILRLTKRNAYFFKYMLLCVYKLIMIIRLGLYKRRQTNKIAKEELLLEQNTISPLYVMIYLKIQKPSKLRMYT